MASENDTYYRKLAFNRALFLRALIGLEVPIANGETGRITSVSVTSDGFLLGRTDPGYDRGVFLGQMPDDATLMTMPTDERRSDNGNA